MSNISLQNINNDNNDANDNESENAALVVKREVSQVGKEVVAVADSFATFLKEGKVVPLSIAFILSTTCNALIKSLIDDLVLPPVGLAFGNNVQNLFWVLKRGQSENITYATVLEAQADGAVTANWGRFLQNFINTCVVILFVYVLVQVGRAIQATYRDVTARLAIREKEKGPEECDCPYCYKKIDCRATKCPFCASKVSPVLTKAT